MNFSLFKAYLLVCFILIAMCQGKSLVPPSKTTQSSGITTVPTTKRAFVCQCDDTPEPMCANNGVTYKNKCRFDCAAHKFNGLKVVKEGECGKYVSQLQYWSFGK